MLEFIPTLPTWVWAAVALSALLITGAVTTFRRHHDILMSAGFCAEYRNKVIEYANSDGADQQTYHWLILNSNRMQAELGLDGYWSVFRDPPFEYTQYPFIINGITKLQEIFRDNQLHGDILGRRSSFIMMLDASLLRFIGSQRASLEAAESAMRNPMTWLVVGAEQFTATPLYLLSTFGVIGKATLARAKNTKAFRVFAFLIASLIFLMSIASDVTGLLTSGREAWDTIVDFFGMGEHKS